MPIADSHYECWGVRPDGFTTVEVATSHIEINSGGKKEKEREMKKGKKKTVIMAVRLDCTDEVKSVVPLLNELVGVQESRPYQ